MIVSTTSKLLRVTPIITIVPLPGSILPRVVFAFGVSYSWCCYIFFTFFLYCFCCSGLNCGVALDGLRDTTIFSVAAIVPAQAILKDFHEQQLVFGYTIWYW